jgi:CheY-like chemotaxis protein
MRCSGVLEGGSFGPPRSASSSRWSNSPPSRCRSRRRAKRRSEFVVTLLVAPDGPAQVRSHEGVQRTSGKRLILVADDNPDSADSLAMLLRHSGHEVYSSYDGLAALEAVAKLRPEVVLLHNGTPKLNGHEACRRIREQPWDRSGAIFALTGWGDEQARNRARVAGFDGHLT